MFPLRPAFIFHPTMTPQQGAVQIAADIRTAFKNTNLLQSQR
jgi:hypothetical protein